MTRLTRCECPWQCTGRWQASDNSNRLCVDQHRGGPAAPSNTEDRKFKMKLSKAQKKSKHPKTVRDVLSARSPQILHHNTYRKWQLALRILLFPRLLVIPISLPNVSILLYLLSFSPLCSLDAPYQASGKVPTPSSRQRPWKQEQKCSRSTVSPSRAHRLAVSGMESTSPFGGLCQALIVCISWNDPTYQMLSVMKTCFSFQKKEKGKRKKNLDVSLSLGLNFHNKD